MDGGDKLAVFNTHLQSQYCWNLYAEVRTEQLQQLCSAARELPAELPVIAAGDLNTPSGCSAGFAEHIPTPCEEDKVYAVVTDTWDDLTDRRRDECEKTHEAWGCVTNYDDRQWIDYVLSRRSDMWQANAHVEVLLNIRKDLPFSDHQGLAVDLSITRRARASLSLGALAAARLTQPSTRLSIAKTYPRSSHYARHVDDTGGSAPRDEQSLRQARRVVAGVRGSLRQGRRPDMI